MQRADLVNHGNSHLPGTSLPAPWVAMGSAYGSCTCQGAQPVTDPACCPDTRTACVFHPWMGFPPNACPAPWAYMWVPFSGYLWMGCPLPAASAPSFWPTGSSSFDPHMGSQHLAAWASSVFPYPMGPPPPYPSVPPTLGRDASGRCPQLGSQTPANPAFRATVQKPCRGAPHVQRHEAPPLEWASRFSIWARLPPCSSELCPLSPSPIEDPQPKPRRCLFES
ncbi:PREDICTED: putative uncharacterized protein C3orf56 homolog [Galeopterus variegatus]|uniref:Uncharacterized protein n=1 Tax=Galeopterus variegatus TaxID=482537 RepID=A0ABM0SIQ8_GALVR|nr:PREDICTED: putative uncharacterized protein C3orf56 homolog [Galeopterus variegatus]